MGLDQGRLGGEDPQAGGRQEQRRLLNRSLGTDIKVLNLLIQAEVVFLRLEHSDREFLGSNPATLWRTNQCKKSWGSVMRIVIKKEKK